MTHAPPHNRRARDRARHWHTERAVRRLVNETTHALGHGLLNVRIVFDHRLSRIVGQAEWTFEGHHTIRLSPLWWAYMGDEDRRETIVHEACHLTSAIENGVPGDVLEHCELWHEHMAWVGYVEPAIDLRL